MYMYLSAGVPVVGTDIRELRRHSPWVLCPTEGRDLRATIEKALESSVRQREERRAFAAQNTWAVRAAAAVSHLQETGLLNNTSLNA
jgi:glycosyltransferase involved in cell wall biosynthesis